MSSTSSAGRKEASTHFVQANGYATLFMARHRVWLRSAIFRTMAMLGLLWISLPAAQADIVLSVDLLGNTNVILGPAGLGQNIEIFIAQDAVIPDSLIATAASFQLEAGVVTSGIVTATGVPGTPGFFGAGNTSNSTFSISPSGDSFNIDQEYTDGDQLPLLSPLSERLASIEIDTTGVAPGTYAINLLAPQASFASQDPQNMTINFLASNNNLTFTVTAVPEPSALAFCVLVGCGVVFRKRRKDFATLP